MYLTQRELLTTLAKVKKNKKVVFTSGVFDLFHFGHFIALKKASLLGDILVVQVDGNQLVRKRKGYPRPYFSQEKRAKMINSLTFVDYVFTSNKPSESESTLHTVKPDFFVRALRNTETNATRKQREKSIVRKYSPMEIVWMKETKEISTSKIVQLLENDLKLANNHTSASASIVNRLRNL